MYAVDTYIVQLYRKGKCLGEIKKLVAGTFMTCDDIAKTLVIADTRMEFNVMKNKYDTVIIPSKINYKKRL
jgi:hypothetical protein